MKKGIVKEKINKESALKGTHVKYTHLVRTTLTIIIKFSDQLKVIQVEYFLIVFDKYDGKLKKIQSYVLVIQLVREPNMFQIGVYTHGIILIIIRNPTLKIRVT